MKQYTLIIISLIFLVTACHQPSDSSIHNRPISTPPQQHSNIDVKPEIHTKPIETTPPDNNIPNREDHPRWLMTQRYKVDSKDTWVKASFDAKRNKIKIDIRNIRLFAIDTRQMNINWNRPVILGINDRNSELKKRDYPILRFELDEYNQWQVVEP